MARGHRFAPRLLLERCLREGDLAPLSAAQTHYLRRVLRLREGDAARVFDGAGAEREATVVAGARDWNLKIGAAARGADATFAVAIAQIAGGGARGDWAVEKMCEAGVAAFVPLHRGEPPRESALARWRRIVAASCAQCGRARLMRIEPPRSFAAWIGDGGGGADAKFLLTPRAEMSLWDAARESPRDCAAATLLLGGEDGFSAEEERIAGDNGFAFAALGARIFRFETAPAIAAALLLARVESERAARPSRGGGD